MPFVEKKLDEFFTAENAESAEKRFTTENMEKPSRQVAVGS